MLSLDTVQCRRYNIFLHFYIFFYAGSVQGQIVERGVSHGEKDTGTPRENEKDLRK